MKKSLIILLAILFIGSGYVVYDTIQSNKAKESDLADLQAEIQELNAQLSGVQLSGSEAALTTGTAQVAVQEEPIIQTPTPKVVSTWNNTSTTPTQPTIPQNPPITQPTTSYDSNSRYRDASARDSLCKYRNDEWLPTTARGQAAKSINSKLQYVRDNGQQHTQTIIQEWHAILSNPTASTAEKCKQYWLIDELSHQKWFVRLYDTKNGITTIGIDFLSLQDDISKIQWDGSPWLDLYKNTSTKVRYYTLSNNPNLQIITTDQYGKVQNGYSWPSVISFDKRIDGFCNNEPIYTDERKYEEVWENWIVTWSWYTDLINWNEWNRYCIKDYLHNGLSTYGQSPVFQFNQNGQLQEISTSHRVFSNAG